ncbi:hypothetical protein SPBR_09131 [Sporothrix brasiliensis 5110]|uniref:Uncharacterized protein n=1 Tax=Sporothrix brasiliensis 5110 TaxID=1398154 RepID=A0A0C2FP68_9PEZI|nr:uncharacterized protein SPBR_09131 [Sporothrix brasiliensis 5110]KIH92848.1 hypothetical protein SPBR_09131 [Sporothrix brasiliensis 5110]
MASVINPFRDIFFADLRDPSTDLGGLISSTSITQTVFYSIVAVVINCDKTAFDIQNDNGEQVARDDDQVLPGRYLIVSDEPAIQSKRPFFTRALSTSASTRLESFRNQVRARDGRCTITKVASVLGPSMDIWTAFEVAHLVPIAYTDEWRRRGFSDRITVPPPPPRERDTINSVQNGLLMQSHIHQAFDAYHFSILPSSGYKLICFQPDIFGIAGTYLDQQLLQDHRRPPDELLEWHFEQAVLCNARGAGEPNLEFDFPPGSDMVGEILAGPKAAERMEFELFSRLDELETEQD